MGGGVNGPTSIPDQLTAAACTRACAFKEVTETQLAQVMHAEGEDGPIDILQKWIGLLLVDVGTMLIIEDQQLFFCVHCSTTYLLV